MSWSRHGLAIAIAAAFATNAEAHATACDVSISSISPIPNVIYDPFEGQARTVNYVVGLTNAGADECSVGIAIGSPPPGAPRTFKNGADTIRYLLEWPGGAVFQNNIAAPVGTVRLYPGQTRNITLRVKVEAGLIAPAATYSDVLTFRLYRSGAGPLVQVGTDRTATAGAVVEARAQVNIAGASGAFGTPFALSEIAFGTLTTGATKGAIVQVRATSPVSIAVSSQNQGKLKHKTVTADPGVPYSMQLDGTAVGLAGASFSLNRSPPITLDGINYPMSLTIGDVAGRPSGEYQDTLTINVAPL